MQLNNYYCFKDDPSDIEIDMAINQDSLDDIVRLKDRDAVEEYENVKLGTMYKYGWNQMDYSINLTHYQSKYNKLIKAKYSNHLYDTKQ